MVCIHDGTSEPLSKRDLQIQKLLGGRRICYIRIWDCGWACANAPCAHALCSTIGHNSLHGRSGRPELQRRIAIQQLISNNPSGTYVLLCERHLRTQPLRHLEGRQPVHLYGTAQLRTHRSGSVSWGSGRATSGPYNQLIKGFVVERFVAEAGRMAASPEFRCATRRDGRQRNALLPKTASKHAHTGRFAATIFITTADTVSPAAR